MRPAKPAKTERSIGETNHNTLALTLPGHDSLGELLGQHRGESVEARLLHRASDAQEHSRYEHDVVTVLPWEGIRGYLED